ncbi:MAG: hypothetical protein ABI237_02630 [Ginsengibacter sp.]
MTEIENLKILDGIYRYLEKKNLIMPIESVCEEFKISVYDCSQFLNRLMRDNYVQKIILGDGEYSEGYSINKSNPLINGYESKYLKDYRQAELLGSKLLYETENAKKVVESYPRIKFIAWASFIVALFLLFLKLAEALNIWPYNK